MCNIVIASAIAIETGFPNYTGQYVVVPAGYNCNLLVHDPFNVLCYKQTN